MKLKYFGYAGHFCCGHMCRFHLATQVGEYLISTVGDMHTFVHPGEKDKMQEIGYNRFFETMVFEFGKICHAVGCGCGMPEINGNELDSNGYKTAGEAERGHTAMIKKWQRKQSPKDSK
jgi:hypothetical protein